ncbi:CIC11C00000003272 [Sungouiella intermedia]|uniref:CIC11C00000003272 n=1 Tax=Sungouiella intermedia TaxID=45354 RepID=A0A1L0B9P1_9ASCO|nr:CIC11C00000003272 [[Candida] intermedia]
MNSRKHLLSEDPEPPISVKKIRLETLLQNLTLEPTRPIAKPAKFSINTMFNSEQDSPRQSRIDSYISEKIMQEFKDKLYQDNALIKWVPPFLVITAHFQRWVKRLFNMFVKRFNEHNPHRAPIRRFPTYLKIIQLVRDPNVAFTLDDLANILKEYNLIESRKLALKKDKRADSKKVEEIHEEERIARETKYAYWDRFSNLREDVVMEEGIYGLDMEMDSDSPVRAEFVEANYGNYY